jgi:hypothetical protein
MSEKRSLAKQFFESDELPVKGLPPEMSGMIGDVYDFRFGFFKSLPGRIVLFVLLIALGYWLGTIFWTDSQTTSSIVASPTDYIPAFFFTRAIMLIPETIEEVLKNRANAT